MAYQPEPPCAAPYEGNAAVVRASVAAWRLAMTPDAPERIVAEPWAFGVGSRPPMVRPAVLASAGMLLFLLLFPFAPAIGLGEFGPVLRLAVLVACLALVDSIVFGGRGDGTRAVQVETQEEGLKWMEGMEIGHLGWGELRGVLLWHEVRDGEAAVEQTRRGGRRLLLTDAVGRHVFVEEHDEQFDRLLARVRMERPDVPTRVVTPEQAAERLAFGGRDAGAGDRGQGLRQAARRDLAAQDEAEAWTATASATEFHADDEGKERSDARRDAAQ